MTSIAKNVTALHYVRLVAGRTWEVAVWEPIDNPGTYSIGRIVQHADGPVYCAVHSGFYSLNRARIASIALNKSDRVREDEAGLLAALTSVLGLMPAHLLMATPGYKV